MTPEKSRFALLLAWQISSIGGVNGVARNLLHEFQAAKQMPLMAIEMSGKEIREVPVAGDCTWPVLTMPPLPTWNPHRPVQSSIGFCLLAPFALWRLISICRRYSISVLNPHFIGLEYLMLAVLRKSGFFRGKLILSFHGADIREMMQSRGVKRWLSRVLLRSADFLVPCSNGLGEEVLMFVPECAPRTVVIHNGIDTARFLARASEPYELPKNFAGRRIILNIGAYEFKKGHDILVKAFALVKAKRSDVALVISGQRSSIEIDQLGKELGVRQDMLLLENTPPAKVAALLKQADVFALSTRSKKGFYGEGFAIALLEAGAAAKPVVAADSCGVSELIADGITGRVVPPEDPEALAEGICSLLEDPARASQMGRCLHQKVVQNFTNQDMYRKYAELIIGPPNF